MPCDWRHLFVKHHNARRDTGAVEEVWRQTDNALNVARWMMSCESRLGIASE